MVVAQSPTNKARELMATAATKKAAATKNVYYANVAFYVPCKGYAINEIRFSDDYEGLVQSIMKTVFFYAGDDGFQNFDAKATQEKPESSKTSLTVSHRSWKKPYKATVVAGRTGLQQLFDHCLHKTVVEGETMHEALVRYSYMGEDEGFVVREGVLELPAKTPLHFMSMAYHDNEKNDMVMYLDMQTDYVTLMQRWINHLGAFGDTTFKITNAVATPLGLDCGFGYEGDLKYQLTVEHPSWDRPQTVSTFTGNNSLGFKNCLTELCLKTAVRTDNQGYEWTIDDILEEEHGVRQACVHYREGTYPYMPANKEPKEIKKPEPEPVPKVVLTPNLAILPDLKLSPDVLSAIEAKRKTPGELRYVIENTYAKDPWGGMMATYVQALIFDNFNFRIHVVESTVENVVRFWAREVDGLRGIDIETGLVDYPMTGNLSHAQIQQLLANYVRVDFEKSLADYGGFSEGFPRYMFSLKKADDLRMVLTIIAKWKPSKPKTPKPRKPKAVK